MTKPKVAVIGLKGLPAFGGAAAVGENIIERLKEDYDFTVYSVSSHTHLPTGRHDGVLQKVMPQFPIRKLNVIVYYFWAAFNVLFKRYDLVHLHHSDVALILAILRLRHKVIITSHGSQYQRVGINFKYNKIESALLLFSEKYFLRLANTITCVSASLSRSLSEKYGRTVHYIPNGYAPLDLDSEAASSPYKEPYILFAAGRIIPTKGCHVFLSALKQIGYKGKVVVAGDLAQLSDYKQKVLELSNGLNVDFVGLIKDKQLLFRYLQNARLFVFPSSLETMSMMLLEAASAKCPIVSSDIVANTDVLGPDEAFFFKTDDVQDFAQKMDMLLSNKDLGKKISENALAKVKKRFDWDNISQEYDQLYRQLLT
jgi:glycosyltransferase involved in cell wall biosynthesis